MYVYLLFIPLIIASFDLAFSLCWFKSLNIFFPDFVRWEKIASILCVLYLNVTTPSVEDSSVDGYSYPCSLSSDRELDYKIYNY